MKRAIPHPIVERNCEIIRGKDECISSYFGEDTFNQSAMEDKLPKEIQKKLQKIIHEGLKLDLDTANIVAHGMKEWAIEKGATHYCHWFQPMTGATAEKHDAFVEFISDHQMVERFSGKQLVQGEPDASSFPSGGLRSTFEARGYTAWDITSPAFILRGGIGTVLCIPSVFISYTGEALDNKTPLLRSINAVNKAALNVMRAMGNNEPKKVYATLGPEQEYFLIDIDNYYKRQDLVLTGRALLGASPAKGQQLEDHYFGSIKDRIFSYMHDLEEELYKLGIPAKTRHNEVAPSQYEIAPIFEEANLAVDHNHLVMDIMRKVARRHNLSALLHEKPFAGINGSGKHVNWSLSDDLGNNLLNPGDTPHQNLQFLVVLVATIRAVYRHADILRASVATVGNDHRLGANEAPPAIISVFLGEQLTRILNDILQGKVTGSSEKAIIDLGISSLPDLSKDSTDRNRTSPFAFTGNKFEFRAVGSAQSISFSAAVLNTIVAESLDYMADRIKAKSGNNQALFEILKEEIKDFQPILFMGDNYSSEWEAEAKKRGLPNKKTSPESLKDLVSDKMIKLFSSYKVLSEVETKSRYHIKLEQYVKELDIETMTQYNMAVTQIVPAAYKYQKELASSIQSAVAVMGNSFDVSAQKELLGTIASLIGTIQKQAGDLLKKREKATDIHDEYDKAAYYCNDIKPLMLEMRTSIDHLETIMDDELWPIPKFWEMLFIC